MSASRAAEGRALSRGQAGRRFASNAEALCFAFLIALAPLGCGGTDDSQTRTAEINAADTQVEEVTGTVPPPAAAIGGSAGLVAAAEAELRDVGGFEQWRITRIEPAGKGGLVIRVDQLPDDEGEAAAVGICITLRHPVITEIKLGEIRVIGRGRREIRAPECGQAGPPNRGAARRRANGRSGGRETGRQQP